MPSLQGVRFYFSTLPGLKEERTLPHPSLRWASQRNHRKGATICPSFLSPHSLHTRRGTIGRERQYMPLPSFSLSPHTVFFCCRTGVKTLVVRGRGGGCMDESMQREGYVIGSFFIRAYRGICAWGCFDCCEKIRCAPQYRVFHPKNLAQKLPLGAPLRAACLLCPLCSCIHH